MKTGKLGTKDASRLVVELQDVSGCVYAYTHTTRVREVHVWLWINVCMFVHCMYVCVISSTVSIHVNNNCKRITQ